jgi:AcrR family transcriptional regulator
MTRVKSARVAARRYGGKSAEQRRAERRAVLIATARDIWQEQGWAAVTMRGVCARAGLTDRYFYESFADRDAVLSAVWDEARDETVAMVLDTMALSAHAAPLEQLRAAMVALVHQIADQPARAQILFGDHAGSAVLEERRRATIQQSSDLLILLARPFLQERVDEQALRITVLVGIGGFVELVLAWRCGLLDVDADALVEHLSGVAAALAPRFLRQAVLA